MGTSVSARVAGAALNGPISSIVAARRTKAVYFTDKRRIYRCMVGTPTKDPVEADVVVGSGRWGDLVDPEPLNCRFRNIWDLAMTSKDTLLIADRGNNRILAYY